MNRWLEIERKWYNEFKEEFPEDAKKLDDSFQKDFIEMEKYGKDLEKLTEEFAKKFTIDDLKMENKKYLNLGCGNNTFYDCINIDSEKEYNPDLVCDIKHLPYEHNSIDGIFALDVLEHVPRNLVLSTLESWHKILKIGGFLILRLPDIRSISEKYLKGKIDATEFSRLIYGGQEKFRFVNFHQSGFDEKTLTKLLKHVGFKKLKEYIEIPCNDNNMLLKFEKM